MDSTDNQIRGIDAQLASLRWELSADNETGNLTWEERRYILDSIAVMSTMRDNLTGEVRS